MKVTGYLKNLDSLLFTIAGYVIIHFFLRYDGVGISPDAVMYISTARNLHAFNGFNFFSGAPLVDFPVFYPVFLTIVFFLTGTDPLMAGPVLDGLLFAGVIFTSGVLMQRFAPKSMIYKWVVLLAIVLSPALLQVYTYLWSETLFIFLVLLFFIAFANYLNKRTLATLIIAAVVAAITAITRYAGVTVIATGGLLLLIDDTLTLKKRWKPIIIYSVIAVSLLAVNIIRNRLATGNSTGPRERSITQFIDNLSYFGSTMAGWMGINSVPYSISLLIGMLVILALVAALLFHTFKRNLNHYLVLAIAFSLIYGLFIILSSTFSRYERINNRLLSPMYIPMLWALTWWVVHLPARWRSTQKLPVYIGSGLIALFIVYRLAIVDYQRYDDQFDYGMPGYTDDSWKDSQIVPWMKQHPEFFKNSPIYSEAYEAVYFFTGHKNVKLLPHLYFQEDIDNFYALRHYYLIWFSGLPNPELITLKDIQQKQHLKLIKNFSDGAIYEYGE